ncbi:hypothetical protein [Methylobacterium sp. WSM2598]|uniref:hypothetical protein n=1 Tax=Methylobacterium sp. WSM2598 TaxID=398261 RepID=UPI00037E3D2E|nr:hypothetical protein [Methylobacterium sp. WSM2598]
MVGWVPTAASGMGDVGAAPSANEPLWLAGRNGTVWRTDDGKDFEQLTGHGLPPGVTRIAGSHGRQFADTRQNVAWAVTGAGELWRFNGQGWTKTKASGMLDVAVSPFDRAWVLGQNGTVWMTGEVGDQFVQVRPHDGAPVFIRIAVVPDLVARADTIWLAGNDGSLWRLNPSQTDWWRTNASEVGDVALGPHGRLWLAGTNGTVWHSDGVHFTRVSTLPDRRQLATPKHDQSLPPLHIESLAGRGNTVWGVTNTGELWKFDATNL